MLVNKRLNRQLMKATPLQYVYVCLAGPVLERFTLGSAGRYRAPVMTGL